MFIHLFCLRPLGLTIKLDFNTSTIKTDESITLVHTVRISKQEANLAGRPEKCLDLSFLNLFRGILIFCINGNS